MLSSLVIEAIGTGRRPRRALMARVLNELVAQRRRDEGYNDPLSKASRHERVRGLWVATAERVAAHGDPTPRTNPLA